MTRLSVKTHKKREVVDVTDLIEQQLGKSARGLVSVMFWSFTPRQL
jgi:hypothetical protein